MYKLNGINKVFRQLIHKNVTIRVDDSPLPAFVGVIAAGILEIYPKPKIQKK
jgi:hypothetical protein